MRIVVLGGAGIMGRAIASDLASDPEVKDLLVADRDLRGAREVARELNRPGVVAAEVEVTDHPALVRLLEGAGATVNAAHHDVNPAVMTGCLDARTHYIDLGGLFHTTRRQLELEDDFRKAGLLAIPGLGACPGISNLQARALADDFDSVESIRIYDGATPDQGESMTWPDSIDTILDGITRAPIVFRRGQFIEAAPLGEEELYRFNEPIGTTGVHLALRSEVATLPLTYARKGIRECLFKVSFFGCSEKALRQLHSMARLGLASTETIDVNGTRVRPRDVLVALLKQSSRTVRAGGRGFREIVTEVRGMRGGRAVTGRVETVAGPNKARGLSGGTLLAASPAAFVARWLARGWIKSRGVVPPEQALEPVPFFQTLEARGARTTLSLAGPYPD